jgi:hypothetical protein
MDSHPDSRGGEFSPEFSPKNRPSILRAGDVYNQKKIEREALRIAIQDENLMPQ